MIFGHHRRSHSSTECVFDHFCVPCFTNENTDARVFMCFANVAVESFEVEGELADVFGLQLAVPVTEIDTLWGRVRDAHETWVASLAERAVA